MSRMLNLDETTLPYFHGALMDQDVNGLLQTDGDFLLQTKRETGSSKPKLYLAVRVGKEVKRFEVKRNETGAVRIGNKTKSSVPKLIENLMAEAFTSGSDSIQIKRPVTKGKFQLNHNDIKIMKKIGSGAYGTVYRGHLVKDRKIIAAKRLDSDGIDELAEMMKEARVMQMYDHPNIVRFYGYIVDRTPYLLVMEYCEGGSLEDKLRSRGNRILIPTRVDMVAQAATGLEYLHSKECIHRDIAARNCLLDKGIVKLADFGMCRATSVYKVDLSKPLNVRWLAPEVWRNGETRYNTDIYAFGVLIWEMFEIPYACPYSEWKAYTVKQKVMAGYRMKPSEHMPEEMGVIMDLAWNHDPEKRPDTAALRKLLDEVNKKYPNDHAQEQSTNQEEKKSRSRISRLG